MHKLKDLKLKNGNTHPLNPINIFIGPNNSGKSTLLQELNKASLKNVWNSNNIIFDDINCLGNSTIETIKQHLDAIGDDNYKIQQGGGMWVTYTAWEQAEKDIQKDIQGYGKRIFIDFIGKASILLDGKQRLGILNDKTYKGADEEASNIFEKLHHNPELKKELQKYISPILKDKYFCIWNPKQGHLRAYLSDRKPINEVEYKSSPDAREFFNSAKELAEYSDGIKAFLGILVNIIGEDKPIFIIDEPEAFLHPNLCYQLGKILTDICNENSKTCFIATHSPHFLKGCLTTYPEECSITRLEYANGLSKSHSLDSSEILTVMRNPLLSNIGVTEALFHARVVVVEGDSDRAFYNEINGRMLKYYKGGIDSCLFINAQNKQTIAKIIILLRSIGISCAAITDIDVFKEGGTNYANIVKAMKMPTGVYETLRNDVDGYLRKALDSSEPVTLENIENIVAQVKEDDGTPISVLDKIKTALRRRDYKREGGIKLLEGSQKDDADHLIKTHADKGWFIVPHGEVEVWLENLDIGRSKGKFLTEVFNNMGSDPTVDEYLKPPDELDDVWLFIKNINDWFEKEK